MKLEIVIPVKERTPMLLETLATIAPQTIPGVCGVFVCDDPVFGFDYAYLNAVSKATGEYVWLFADDDYLLPYAVENVLKALERNPDMVVANAQVRDETMKKILKPSWIEGGSRLVGGSRDNALLLFGDLMSYVGSIIIRRDLWNDVAKERGHEFIGTRFITFALPAIAATENVAFVSHVCSAIRYGHQPWCCDCANLMEHYRDVVWGLEGIFDEVKERLAPKVWPLWKWALWRATGVPLPEGPKAIKALVNAIPREALRRALLLFLIVLGNPDGMTGHTLRQCAGKSNSPHETVL